MIFYHRTNQPEAILREGFRDNTSTYFTSVEFTGVFVSDRPVDAHEGAKGDVLLTLDIPEDVLTEYEWVRGEEVHWRPGEPLPNFVPDEELESWGVYREWCVPAKLLNAYGPPVVFDEYAGED